MISKYPIPPPLELHNTNRISITFETQKNGRKFDSVMQWRTGHTPLCPIIQWAALVKQILSYPGSMKNTKVSTVMIGTRISNIMSKIVKAELRNGVKTYGKTKLQIYTHEVGMHSIH